VGVRESFKKACRPWDSCRRNGALVRIWIKELHRNCYWRRQRVCLARVRWGHWDGSKRHPTM